MSARTMQLATTQQSDRRFAVFNAVVSFCALGLLFWLLLIRRGGATPSDGALSFMPAVNASFNALAAVLLTCGFIAVRRGRADIHRYFMVSAFASSAMFLLGYVAYHYVHGDTKYVGAHRGLYLSVLASHVLLSMVVLPMALSGLYFAWRRDFARHRKVNRVLLPIWLYVSVTGVLIFFMLRNASV